MHFERKVGNGYVKKKSRKSVSDHLVQQAFATVKVWRCRRSTGSQYLK